MRRAQRPPKNLLRLIEKTSKRNSALMIAARFTEPRLDWHIEPRNSKGFGSQPRNHTYDLRLLARHSRHHQADERFGFVGGIDQDAAGWDRSDPAFQYCAAWKNRRIPGGYSRVRGEDRRIGR